MKNTTGISIKSNKSIGFSNVRSVTGSIIDEKNVRINERGQGMLEFLIIIGLILIIGFVIVTLTQIAYTKIICEGANSQATKEAADIVKTFAQTTCGK